MNPFVMLRLAIAITMLGGCSAPWADAWEALRAHPQNPYLFEFRGRPAVLRTFGEHYSSVINRDFDFVPYLDVLQRDEMNLTRVFLAGFRLVESDYTPPSPLAPSPDRFVQPWPRSTSNGSARDGLGKWDFSSWNDEYFTRLHAFVQACADRGIVAELTLFSTFYHDAHWQASPFNPANNVQGYGPANRYDAFRAVDANLLAVQKAVVRKIAREMNRYDNIYYEIENEPFWDEPGVKDPQEVQFHNTMLGIIRDEEAGLEFRHLVAHNFPQYAGQMSTGFDVVNEHYPVSPDSFIAGAEALLRNHYSRGKILGLGETHTPSTRDTRLEAWMFLIGGGGIYNGLDFPHFVYSTDNESGDNELGRSFRREVRNIGSYIDNLHLVPLRRDLSWIANGIQPGASMQAMANPGQQYVAYFHHGQKGGFHYYNPIDDSDHTMQLVVTLPAGTWRAAWTRPADLMELHAEVFTHAGGEYALAPVNYQENIALRVDRTGDGDTTPPPAPKRLAAIANDDGSIALSWQPVQAADLATYHIYRAEQPGVPIDVDHRITTLPSTDSAFTDTLTQVGISYHYHVTAADAPGNESSASGETSATSVMRSQPYGGTVRDLPGSIEAEDFDSGGQGLAYNDLTPGNIGGEYRENEWVDLAITTDVGGGFHVSATEAGEWLQYTIRVTTPGILSPAIRVANTTAGGEIHLEVDGLDVSGTIPIPETGGMDAWQTIAAPPIVLSAGPHVLRLVIDGTADGGIAGAIDWISFTAIPSIGPTAYAGSDFELVDQGSDGLEPVTLDGGGSMAGDVPIVSYVWQKDGMSMASGVNPTLILEAGEHSLRLVVTDEYGLQHADDLTVRVLARSFMNGSFEAGYDGWSASGIQELGTGPFYRAADGSWLITFNSGNRLPGGMVSQTFATVPGQLYLLSFDMGVIAYNNLEQRLQVGIAGTGTRVTRVFSITGGGAGSTRWVTGSIPFTSQHPATTLSFRDVSPSTTSLDLLLDNIRIVPQIVRTLVVESSPDPGVVVTVSPPDNEAAGNGATPFSRGYMDGTSVNLTAPPSVAGKRFVKWLANGVDYGTSPSISVSMDGDHTLSAVYVETAPIIIHHPASLIVGAGGGATFRVTAEGSGTLFYQWRFNGGDIPGADADTYIIADARDDHGGAYDVVVSNAIGQATSNPVVLTVLTTFLVNGSFEEDYQGWTASGNHEIGKPSFYLPTDGGKLLAFNSGGRPPNGTLSQTFATTPGQPYQLSFEMGAIAYNTAEQRLKVEVTGNTPLVSQSHTVTGAGSGITRWITKTINFTADSTATTLTFRDQSGPSDVLDLLLDNIRIAPRLLRTLVVASSPTTGVNVTANPPDDNGAGNGSTNFNRSFMHGTSVSLSAPATAGGYRFAKWLRNGVDHGTGSTVGVTMDGDHTLTAMYVESAPVIASHPASLNTVAGGSATFRVTAEGTGSLFYQWRFNGTGIPGAEAAAYTIDNVQQHHAGTYDVVVSNSIGPAASNPASLTITTILLVNGSFENGYQGWTASGNQSIGTPSFYQPTDGSRLVAFNGGEKTPNGVLSQSIPTNPGQSYLLSFDMGVIAYNTGEQRLQVDLNGSSALVSQTFTIQGGGSGITRWSAKTLAFTANSPTTTLTIRDRSPLTSALDLLLDHVRISVQAAAAAPQVAAKTATAGGLPLATPSISRVDGAFRIGMTAASPGRYELQRSRDLKTWEPAGEIHLSEPGVLEFTDPSPMEERMFYRIARHSEAPP